MATDYTARPISHYLAHRRGMCLPDKITHVEALKVSTCAYITEDNMFYDAEKNAVPSWAGIEYMAQTAAIWVGIHDEKHHKPIQMGFLIGTRRYEAHEPVFHSNQLISIHVFASFVEDNVIVFDGEIHDQQGNILATGNLTAFRPDDMAQYLKDGEPNEQ